MAFDGLPRSTPAALLTPYHHMPRAGATFVAPARALNASYTYGQTHSRFLFSHQWSWNGRSPADLIPTQYFEQSTQQLLFQANVFLPDQITRIAAMVYFRVGANSSGVAATPGSTHHIVVANGSGSDTGADFTAQHPPIPFMMNPANTRQLPTGGNQRMPFAGMIDPAMPFADVYSVGCYVDLVSCIDGSGNMHAPNPFTISVYGTATNEDGSAVTYAPVALVGWWESN